MENVETAERVTSTKVRSEPPLVSWLAFPVLMFGIVAGTWKLLGTDLPKPLASGAPVLITVIAILILERVSPMHRAWNRRPDGVDLFLLVINRFIDLALLAGAVSLITVVAPRMGGIVGGIWPTGLPIAAQVVLGVTIAEAIRYGLHRVSHRPGFLGRVHRVHHQPDRMYSLNGPRLHPVNYFWAAGAHTLPMVLLGAPLEAVILTINVTAFFVIFQHSNVRLRFDGLNKVFATPDIHRLHHLKSSPVGEVNFAIVLSVFDRMFGTFAMVQQETKASDIGLVEQKPLPSASRRLARTDT